MRVCARGALPDADIRRLGHPWPARWLVAAALLLGLLAPSPARAADAPEYFGANLQTIGFIPQDRWSAYFAPLQTGQMSLDRIEVRWPSVEPTAPTGGVHRYDWSSTDFLLATMAARGLRAAPLFRFTPDWTHAPGDEFPPSAYDDYAAMIAAFAKRYGPGGAFWAARKDLTPRPVLTYEVWNEANLDQYAWNGHADAAVYSAVLRAVRPVLKAAQPGALLVGSLAWQNSGPGVVPDFVDKLRAAGGLGLLDAMGYHPYAPDAQSILNLVTGLRAELTAAGYPNLPIFANETGQPVDYAGPGAQYAYAGRPSDAARASSLAFAGEALAASDCNVGQFFIYTLVGTETDLEPIGEGYMGMLHAADGTPNVTGAALQRASLRWVSRFSGGHLDLPSRLSLCSGGPSPEAALLRIGSTFTGGAPGCLSVTTTYDGNPLESAVLRLLDPTTGAQVAEARTDAFGNAAACIPVVMRGQQYTAYADIAGAGRTAVVRCDVPGVGCQPGLIRTGLDAVTSAASQLPQAERPAAPRPCTWVLNLNAQRPRKGGRGAPETTKVRMQVDCWTAPPGARVAVTVLLARGKHGASKKQRVVWLDVARRRTILLKARVRKGDRLIAHLRPNPALGAPYARRQITLGRVVGR